MTKDEMLKTINTRQLLGAKGANRHMTDSVTLSKMVKGGIRLEYQYSMDEIIAELSLRPHVPNKNESRGLRLKKIREGV